MNDLILQGSIIIIYSLKILIIVNRLYEENISLKVNTQFMLNVSVRNRLTHRYKNSFLLYELPNGSISGFSIITAVIMVDST